MKAFIFFGFLTKGDSMFLEASTVLVYINIWNFTVKILNLVLEHVNGSRKHSKIQIQIINHLLISSKHFSALKMADTQSLLPHLLSLYYSQFFLYLIQTTSQWQGKGNTWLRLRFFSFLSAMHLPSVSLRKPLAFSGTYPLSKAKHDRDESPGKPITQFEGTFHIVHVQ